MKPYQPVDADLSDLSNQPFGSVGLWHGDSHCQRRHGRRFGHCLTVRHDAVSLGPARAPRADAVGDRHGLTGTDAQHAKQMMGRILVEQRILHVGDAYVRHRAA